MQPASRTLPSSRQHHRNRSLSDSQPGALPFRMGKGDRTIQTDPGSTASLFVPSRQAPKPPTTYLRPPPERPSASNSSPQPSQREYLTQAATTTLPAITPQRVKRKPLGASDSGSSTATVASSQHNFVQNDTPSSNSNSNNNARYPTTFEHRDEITRSPGSFASNKIDDVSIKKTHQQHQQHHHAKSGGAKKSIGKLFKRLGSRTFDDEHAGFDEKSKSSTSSSTASFDEHHRPTSPRHPTHNVPLAPPAPPPPQIPLIEVGKRTYLKPELEIGLQETDDLLSQIPIELRTRPMSPQSFNRKTTTTTTTTTTSGSLEHKRKQQGERSAVDNNSNAATLRNIPTSSIYANPSSMFASALPSQQQQQEQQAFPRSILNNREGSSRTRVAHQQQAATSSSSFAAAEDADKDGQNNLSVSRLDLSDDETTNETYPCSRWSNASTGKSSGTYSLYSTFGTESRPASGSSLDLVEAESNFNSQDLKQKVSVYLSGESKTIMARQEQQANSKGEDGQGDVQQQQQQQQGDQHQESPFDLSQIVANNVQRRIVARVINDGNDDDNNPKIPGAFPVEMPERNDHEVQEDSNDVGGGDSFSSGGSSSDDDDDMFVDATGLSQEEIEREKADRRLSKRLSGGHFGSAGGLMLSIGAPPVPSVPEAHRRRSSSSSGKQRRSTAKSSDDVAQAMLNWKRQSDGLKLKRTSQRSRSDSTTARQLDNLIFSEREKGKEHPEPQLLTDAEKAEERAKAQSNLSGTLTTASVPLPSSSRSSPATSASSPSPPQQQQQLSSPATASPPRSPVSPETETLLVKQQQSLPPPPRPPPRRKRSFPLEQIPSASAANYASKELPKPPEIRLENDTPEVRPKFSEDARMAAKRLWEEDESFVPRDRIAEWLGQRKPLNSETLVCYMSYFQFSRMRLDNAFRKLCSKLYFKAEAQQIDRLLEVFAQRYWECNPKSIFGDADIVYAVVYSLLLLNTDLHVAQGNHARMNRQAFVKNTMSTIRDQKEQGSIGRSKVVSKAWEMEMENYLKELYYSVKQYQILQPLRQQQQQQQQQQQLIPGNAQPLEKRSSILGGRRVVELKRSMMWMKDNPQEEPTPRPSTSAGPSTPLGSPRRDSFSSSISITSYGSGGGTGNGTRSNANTLSPRQPMMNFIQNHVSDLFASRPPYLKEGVVVRKHLLENGSQRAKHREWKECFLVVSNGELKMYTMHGSVSEERRSVLRVSSVSNFATLADSLGNGTGGSTSSQTRSSGSVASVRNTPGGGSHQWTSSMPLMGTIVLNHTLSNILPPPGYNRQRPHVFAIQQPHGGVYLFQTTSQEQANEWVETCNYWAARQSKEPLPGGVSNMEYGWGDCLNDVILDLDSVEISGKYFDDPDEVTIYDWRPPAPPSVPSTLDEKEQLAALQKHLHALGEEINEHRELKRKILVKFHAKSQNHSKALANWESKSTYLLHEIIKYQNYCMALEKSAERRQQAEQEKAAAAAAAAATTTSSSSSSSSAETHEASSKLSVVQDSNSNQLQQQQQQQLEYKRTDLDLFSEIGKELQHWNL